MWIFYIFIYLIHGHNSFYIIFIVCMSENTFKNFIWSFIILYLSILYSFHVNTVLIITLFFYLPRKKKGRKVYKQLNTQNVNDNERWMFSSDLDYKTLFGHWTFVPLEINLGFNCCWFFDKFGVQLPTTKLGFLR